MAEKKVPTVVLIIGVALLLGLFQSVYIVDQTQRAIVLQLGKPVGDDKGPGLHFKLPFVQNVIFFDHRILEYDAPPAEILTKDKKNLVVDNYSRWRISDPLLFYRTVHNIEGGRSRLDDIIYAELRVSLGRFTLTEIVSSDRAEIMTQVTDKANSLLKDYGILVLDVRIKRTDLPPENQKAIFGRMRAERERQAKQYRSEGRELGVKISTGADKERAIMLAEAQKKAEVLKGEGDARATEIYAASLGQDPEFYKFVKSLEAYKKGLSSNTRLIMTSENDFLKFLQGYEK
ncbi:MAG: HflC protein [Deltaproteobacteria bacterium]|nr:MAG: HflC protein [Deltaproteobacteria bacterium]